MTGTQAFRDEHAALLEHVEHLRELAAKLPDMESEQRIEASRRCWAFFAAP